MHNNTHAYYKHNPKRKFSITRENMDLVYCNLLSLNIITFFLLTNFDKFAHWFLIPLYMCALVIGKDAIRWINGKYDFFDPVGILGILGYHFFFLAPLLHVHWGYWGRFNVPPPPNWCDWLGIMAILNFLGLLVYMYVRNYFGKKIFKHFRLKKWILTDHFLKICPIAILMMLFLQIGVYMKYGGIMNYIALYDPTKQMFQGMGRIFMITESAPIVLMMVIAIYIYKKKIRLSMPILYSFLFIFFLICIFFGGLTGSRSNTIWKLFWAICIVRYFIHPIRRPTLFYGILVLFIFMYIYGFFKAQGLEGLKRLYPSYGNLLEIENTSGRGIDRLVLTDFGRSDVQAILLYRFMHGEYKLAWGRTYFGDICIVIPRFLWPSRPPNKRKEGTDAFLGEGAFENTTIRTSAVFGLAGEMLLNFGPIGVPFAFIGLGAIVALVKNLMRILHPEDARWLMIPLLINFCFSVLVSDLDNLIAFLGKNATIPFAIIAICSEKHTDSEHI